MKKTLVFAALFFLLVSTSATAAQKVTIIYQNDLHGWLFPSSSRVGMVEMSEVLLRLFEKNPNAFYAVSGDLFTGPDFMPQMKGVLELRIWNHFWKHLTNNGFGDRVLISPGNHDFDYGVPAPDAFSSGLLCANLVNADNQPYYVPYRVVESSSGLRVGFVGLLLTGDRHVLDIVNGKHLKVIPMLDALLKVIPEMGKLDLTVLMVHEYMQHILKLAQVLPARLGVDIILSGHNHMLLERPLIRSGIYIFQAGAMNGYYGRADIRMEDGVVTSVKNRIVPLVPSEFVRVAMQAKEQADSRKGVPVALLEHSLLGVSFPGRENSLGDFAADAYGWATKTDVAMTNSASLRMDFKVYPGEPRVLHERDFKVLNPFGDHLVTGEVTGRQIREILEGDAIRFHNQVSGIRYKVDRKRPIGKRVSDIEIDGRPLQLDRRYTLTHNAYCARPENMKMYLHLKPGSVDWKRTSFLCHEVLADYAKHLKTIDYSSDGDGRIEVIP